MIMGNVMKMEDWILELPGKPPCMLDRELAKIYGVSTTRLNEARERNPKKFLEGIDYYVLSKNEIGNIANCDIDWKGGHPPYAYTKRGAYMFATILNTDEAILHAMTIVEGFCTYSLLMEEIKAGRITVAPNPKQDRPDWIFNNMRKELLDRSPIWRKICKYKSMGLNHHEIALLIQWDVVTIRRHVRRMESCGLLVPPKNLPKLQKMVVNLKNRWN